MKMNQSRIITEPYETISQTIFNEQNLITHTVFKIPWEQFFQVNLCLVLLTKLSKEISLTNEIIIMYDHSELAYYNDNENIWAYL